MKQQTFQPTGMMSGGGGGMGEATVTAETGMDELKGWWDSFTDPPLMSTLPTNF